ncbi:hypothetical protein M2168_005748 [Streptomyces sp. CZ24]|nr:hypothetical protein [Streptomyces sp. CZ24]
MAALAVVAQTVIGVVRDPAALFSANHEARIIALTLAGVSLIVFCVLRERRAKELDRSGTSPRPPSAWSCPRSRVGPARCAPPPCTWPPRPRRRSAGTCTRPCAPPPAPG